MADNVSITAGAGTVIATDDVSGVQFQKFKLDVGGDGVSLQPAGSVPVYIVSGTGAYLMNDTFVDAIAIAGQLDDTATTAAIEDKIAPIRITGQRAFHVNLRNATGSEIGLSSSPLVNSGTTEGMAGWNTYTAGNPLVVGGTSDDAGDVQPVFIASGAGLTTRLVTDRSGAPYVRTHPQRIWHFAGEFTAQQTNFTIHSGVAGLSHYISTIYLAVNNAFVTATILENTNQLKWRFYASGVANQADLTFVTPMKFIAGGNVNFSTSAGATVTLIVSGFTAQ